MLVQKCWVNLHLLMKSATPAADVLTPFKQSDRQRRAEEEVEIWMNGLRRLLSSIKPKSIWRHQFCQKLGTRFGTFHISNKYSQSWKKKKKQDLHQYLTYEKHFFIWTIGTLFGYLNHLSQQRDPASQWGPNHQHTAPYHTLTPSQELQSFLDRR